MVSLLNSASPSVPQTMTRLTLLTVLVCLLAAWGLRLYCIDCQSLWADEGNSVAMAPRAIPDIIERTANDIHPPFYYLSLHVWVALSGNSVFAVRVWSVVAGLLTVSLTFALARRIAGTTAALVAAVLATTAPFAIHYSQETRMYMLVTALGAASWLLWLSILTPSQSKNLRVSRSTFHVSSSFTHHLSRITYFLITLVLLYTHYYVVSLVIAQNLAWLWWTIRESRYTKEWWIGWIILQATLVLAYLPWLWYARETLLNWPAISAPITLPFIAQEIFRIFTLGMANEGVPLWLGVLTGIFLMAGIVVAIRQRLGIAALLYFLTPPALMLLLSLDRPFWNPKFLLLALPGYHLLLGMGVSTLLGKAAQIRYGNVWRAAMSTALLVIVLIATYPALTNEYQNPLYARDDYRSMARTIAAQAGPNDAILLDGAGQREVFGYYNDANLPIYGLPTSNPLNEQETLGSLEEIASSHHQLWVLWWAEQESDPNLLIPTWLGENAFEAGSRWYGNVRLARYLLGDPPPQQQTDISFALQSMPTVQLTAIGIEPQTIIAGDVLAIYSQWQPNPSLQIADMSLTFFAQILDNQNRVVGQYDGDGGAPPFAGWNRGQNTSLRFGVPVPVGTIPGTYHVIVGAYHSDTGERLTTAMADAYTVGPLTVTAPVVPATPDAITLPNGHAQDVTFGSLRLIASQTNKLGFDHAPETPLHPGDPASLLLYWQIAGNTPALPALTLQLQDSTGSVQGEWELIPTDNTYPLNQWRNGDLIRDPHIYFLPGDLPAGQYEWMLNGDSTSSSLGSMTIE